MQKEVEPCLSLLRADTILLSTKGWGLTIIQTGINSADFPDSLSRKTFVVLHLVVHTNRNCCVESDKRSQRQQSKLHLLYFLGSA